MNFILSLLGAAILVALGLIIGFWLEVAIAPPLHNGFKECGDCGPSFVETAKWWAGRIK